MAAKELIIVGGANGVGKTTFAIEYASQHQCLYLGADAIAAELAPGVPQRVRVAAGRELTRRLTAAIESQESFVLESTLSGRTLRHTIQEARNAGFVITIMYLFLDTPDTCVERVQERVRKGGHSVPETDIRRRFVRSIYNFWETYRLLADRWLLVYNSDDRPVDVAGGSAEDMTVRDAELFAIFFGWLEGERNG